MKRHYSFRTKIKIEDYLAEGQSVTDFVNDAIERHIEWIEGAEIDIRKEAIKHLENALKKIGRNRK